MLKEIISLELVNLNFLKIEQPNLSMRLPWTEGHLWTDLSLRAVIENLALRV